MRANQNVMVRALAMMLISSASTGCRSATAACFTPSDQTAGWKRVDLPEDYPSLAAPLDVDQFRSGEEAIVWKEQAERSVDRDFNYHFFHNHHHRHHDPFDIVVRDIDPDARHLDIEFEASLQGMHVEASGRIASRDFDGPIFFAERVDSNHVRIDWQGSKSSMTVTLYPHHRSRRIVVRRVRAGELQIVDQQPWAPKAFRATRALYFYHPGGRAIALCEQGARLGVNRERLNGVPTVVDLSETIASVRAGMIRSARRAVTGASTAK